MHVTGSDSVVSSGVSVSIAMMTTATARSDAPANLFLGGSGKEFNGSFLQGEGS